MLRALLFLALLGSPLARAEDGGVVTGRVSFPGARPAPAAVNAKADPFCAKKAPVDLSFLLGEGGAVPNAAIRVLDGGTASLDAGEPVVIEARDCQLSPRVAIVRRGQKVAFRNADGTLHALRGFAGTTVLFTAVLAPKAKEAVRELKLAKGDGELLRVQCDAHPWELAHLVVAQGPAAVSGPEGKFVLGPVPPGEWAVEAWHEMLGKKEARLTVEDGSPAVLDVRFQ